MSKFFGEIESLFQQAQNVADTVVTKVVAPPPLSLPQNDTASAKRVSGLEDAAALYRYDYDKRNAQGVAFVAKVPLTEYPTLKWSAAVAKVTYTVLSNAHQIDKTEGYSPEHLASDAKNLVSAGPNDVAKVGIDMIGMRLSTGRTQGKAKRVWDYTNLFQAIQMPKFASESTLDTTFSRLRLQGANPVWIRAVTGSLPDDFGVTQAHYTRVMGTADSLTEALTDGRLFLCEYRQMLGAEKGGYPAPMRIEIDYKTEPAAWNTEYARRAAEDYANCDVRTQVPAPLALFARPKGSREILPIAIQLFPNTADATHTVFTPSDGLDWYCAKLAVASADATMHQASTHLGLTHLVQEAFALALHNCLSTRHPLHRLLAPHFEGTFSINEMAEGLLIATDGVIDNMICPTINTFVALSAQALGAFDFNACTFPAALEARGVADPSVLPDYPYRDDGMLVWDALKGFVIAYVNRWYQTDADVVADTELQAFVGQVGAYKLQQGDHLVGGHINGVGEEGPCVKTKGYLATMVTQIIFNGSAQHASVNFPQAGAVTHTPTVPYSLISLPSETPLLHEKDLFEVLPPLDMSQLQLGIDHLLGAVYYTQLGYYGDGYFTDPQIVSALADFQAKLADVEKTIDARNEDRAFAYPHLKPSQIPQSINI